MKRKQKFLSAPRAEPPFVEIEGRLYLNQGFDPLGPSAGRGGTVILRPLTATEAALVRDLRLNADTEAWAKVTA